MRKQELWYSHEFGYGVVVQDHGHFMILDFGEGLESVMLERDEVEFISYIDSEEDIEDYD